MLSEAQPCSRQDLRGIRACGLRTCGERCACWPEDSGPVVPIRVPMTRATTAAKRASSSARPGARPRIARCSLIVARGHDAASARVFVFGRSGFDTDLRRAATKRADRQLVDPERIFGGD
jgi:uncharacterized protein